MAACQVIRVPTALAAPTASAQTIASLWEMTTPLWSPLSRGPDTTSASKGAARYWMNDALRTRRGRRYEVIVRENQ